MNLHVATCIDAAALTKKHILVALRNTFCSTCFFSFSVVVLRHKKMFKNYYKTVHKNQKAH